MTDVGDLSAFVTEWRGANREWSKIITTKHMKRWDRTWLSYILMDFRNIDSVLRKITIDLLYFWDVYGVNLREKNFGRSKAYSCRTDVLISFRHFKGKKWTQMKTKRVKQDILNQYESIGFPKLNVASETRTSFTCYGRRVEDS